MQLVVWVAGCVRVPMSIGKCEHVATLLDKAEVLEFVFIMPQLI